MNTLSRRDAVRLFGLLGASSLVAPRMFSADAPPTALPTGTQPGHYRFKIGDLEAIAFADGGFSAPVAECPWSAPQQTEALPGLLENAFVSPKVVSLAFSVLLVKIGGETLLVDTGCGSAFGPVGGKLVTRMAEAGLRPEQVTGVILTHLHGDHFGGLVNAEGKPTFPNATLFIHADEYDFWIADNPPGTQPGSAAGARKCLQTFEGKWQKIRGGDKIVTGLEVINAHGHTPGHIALQITSGNESLLHLVDVVHSHVISFARPDFSNKFDVQSERAIATRKAVLDRAAADRSRVFGAHMPFPALGHVRRTSQAFEYVIEPWAVG